MILGTGVDMCEIAVVASAIERRGDRFLRGLFTPAEQAAGKRLAAPAAASYFAGLFAAKEACAKALGAGIGDRLRWTDLEVLSGADGTPRATLAGTARDALRHPPPDDAVLHVSWRQDAAFALALVVIESA